MEAIHTLWRAVEGTPGADQVRLKKDIRQTINRLRGRVEKRIGHPVTPTPAGKTLFGEVDDRPEPPGQGVRPPELPPSRPRFSEPTLRVYAKDFADHALQHLPEASKYRNADEFRKYLSEKLRFNSEATRRRTANYIVSRFFPGDVYSEDVVRFTAAAARTPALGEALFYLTCRAEKIVSLVAEEVVFPSLAQGGVTRTRLREYVQGKFPDSRSADHIGQAVVRSYQSYGIGTANRTRLNLSVREGSLASFAYVLHLEFPEPGMHAFDRMFDGPMHRWMLWDREWMVRQLYRLRETGLLPKVSEIDRMRQFTTRYTLADAVQRIVAIAKESPE